jgi:hypothetical protein
MKALPYFLIIAGIINHTTVHAQSPSTQAVDLELDFSGVYTTFDGPGVRSFTKPETYPFTIAGERAFNAHTPEGLAGDPNQFDCTLEDMPQILLWGVTIMQIAHEDDQIIMSVERGDTVRSIHMDGIAPPTSQPHTELGYSVGYWSGTLLTVETTHIAGGVMFAAEGHPISQEALITERYWRKPGEKHLQMELVVDDPVNYTQPIFFAREWAWSPDEQVRPYDCTSLELQESEAVDIDELIRRLEQL